MARFEPVSEAEKENIGRKLVVALTTGASEEEVEKLMDMLPILPCLAKSYKTLHGLDALLESDFNLSDAVKEYGEDFIRR